jgi:hypothetical protein
MSTPQATDQAPCAPARKLIPMTSNASFADLGIKQDP